MDELKESDFIVEEKALVLVEPKFYNEEIRKRKFKLSKKIIAVMLVFTLILGTGIGYGLGSVIGNTIGGNYSNSGIVMAASNDTVSSAFSGWPVVSIAKKVSPAIVAIKTKTSVRDFFGDVYESGGTGSGIIIDKEGYIVTNNHVIEGAKNVVVILKDGKELDATLVGTDPQTDLAVIKVNQKNLPFAELGDSSKLEVGELAVAIGSPMGTEYAGSVTAGIISGLDRQVAVADRNMKLIQTDAAINPGNSGGALVNTKGQVIGINTLKLVESKVEGMGFAIPINEAKPIVQQLIQNKKVVRPYLGIQGATISKADADKYDLPTGVYIADVVEYSGADRAGLKRGDVITKLDGKRISKIEEIVEIVRKHKVGDIVEIEIYNELNQYKTMKVKLQESAN